MTTPTEHAAWREQVTTTVVERRPPDVPLAAHLAACAECRDIWRQASGASARLIAASRALPLDAEPPAALRARVLADQRRAAAGETASGPLPAERPRAVPDPDRSGGSGGMDAGGPRSSARRWRVRIAWGSGGALVGAAAVLAITLLASPARVADRIALTGSSLAPAAAGSAVLEPMADGSIRVDLAISGLPRSDAGHFYELWLVGERGRVSAGTFRSDGGPLVRSFMTAADPAAYPRIGITLETDDGNPAASDQRVAGSG